MQKKKKKPSWMKILRGKQHMVYLTFQDGYIVEFACGKVRELDDLLLPNKTDKRCVHCASYMKG